MVHIIFETSTRGTTLQRMEIQITAIEELSDIPPCAIGSIAHLEDFSRIWNLGNDGEWKEI